MHEPRTWSWNKNANEISCNLEEDGYSDLDESDKKHKKSRSEKTASPEICLIEIKWNKEGKNNVQGEYRKKSQLSLKRAK